jgi:hypothetical protein
MALLCPLCSVSVSLHLFHSLRSACACRKEEVKVREEEDADDKLAFASGSALTGGNVSSRAETSTDHQKVSIETFDRSGW